MSRPAMILIVEDDEILGALTAAAPEAGRP